jgi:hypothetical protein
MTAEPLFDVMPSWELFAPPADVPASPSATKNAFGDGVAVYCGIQLGRLRRRFELFEARGIVHRLLASGGENQLPVVGHHLSPEIGLHAWRTGNELRIMLVNFTSVEMTGQATPVGPQTVRIDRTLLSSGPTVTSHRGNKVSVDDDDDAFVVTVEGLREWDCLIAVM